MGQWNAGKLLALSGQYWMTCTLHAGVKLDVFSAIQKERVPAQDLAKRMGVDGRGLATLLDALSAMGLLSKTSGKYANTEESLTWLCRESSQYIGFMIMHHHHLVERWSRLDQAVRSSQRPGEKVAQTHEERESFLMGMFNLAMAIAPRLSEEIDLSGKKHLLDLGGGPGTYAIHFCLANPDLKATVADLSTTRPFAAKTVARFQVSDRVSFTDCDYLKESIPGRYDAVWLSQVLHGEGPDTCKMMLQKAASVLDQGGSLYVHEFILNNTFDGPLFPALFSLNMLVNTEEGRSYTQDQIAEMMRQSGLHDIKRLPFTGPNDSGIMMGTR